MSVALEEEEKGKREVRDSLNKYKRELDRGTAVRAKLDEVIDKIVEDAIMGCPKDTGTLASTIQAIEGASGIFGAGIKGITLYDKSIIAGDPTRTNPKTGRPCNYAPLVHDGHATKSGGWYAGNPFLTDAMMRHEDEAERAVDEALKTIGKKTGW